MYTFKVWLDSGANCQSEYSVEVTTEDLGMTDAEWDALSEEGRDEIMKEIAFERSEWGFERVSE